MNIVIIILVVIGILVVVLLIAGLFVKKEYTVAREITIGKPSQKVFDYIKFLKNQDHYSKWVMMDPQARKVYMGADGQPGFVAAWESDNKKVGKGEQEIKRIHEGKSIDLEIRFIKPFEGKANATISAEALSDLETKVTWVFKSGMKYPMNVMLLFFDIPKMLGKDVSISLSTLQHVLENKHHHN